MPDISKNLMLLANEARNLSDNKFTGEATFTLKMSDGGIRSMSLRIDKSLKTPKKEHY